MIRCASALFCCLLDSSSSAIRVPVFLVSIAVFDNTDERTERLLHGSFGDQFGLN